MTDLDRQLELSVGGPQGIHLRAGRLPPQGASTATPSHALARLQLTGQSQRWLVAHGPAVGGGLAVLGCLALALGVVLVEGLSLSWLLYLPPLAAAVALWIGALAIRAMHRSSRRILATTTEREILHLVAHAREPLTVPETAHCLGLSLADAEAALTDMARAGHVVADVDLDTGRLHFSLPTRHHQFPQAVRP